ncbi:MAG TPA: hypothetical protein VI488_11975 [Candidatus Angelobacter sp.]
MITEDRELELWKEEWRAETGPLPTLKKKVRRQTLWMIAGWVFAVPASVLGLAYFARLAMRDPSPDNIVLTAFVWFAMPLAVAFAVWNQIGTWRPDAESTRAYAELSYKRARSELRGLRVVFYVLYVEVCFLACVIWIFRVKWLLRASPADRFGRLVIVPVVFLGMWIFMIWRRRRRSKQLAEAKSFLEQLDL